MQNNDYYQTLIRDLQFAYACHRIIYKGGQPCDYEFIDVNPAFERISGILSCEIIGKRSSEILKKNKDLEIDSIDILADIASNREKHEYIKYFEALGLWYKIIVFSDKKGYFITFFSDVSTKEVYGMKLEEQSSLFLPFGNLDYQMVADEIMKITDASYVLYYMYDKSRRRYINKAISGKNEHIRMAAEILGFDINKKEWATDAKRDQIKGGRLIRFENINKLASGAVSANILNMVELMFNIGEAFIIEIINNSTTIGFFILLMEKGSSILYSDNIKLYIHRIGYAIIQENAELDLKVSHMQLNALLNNSSSGFLFADREDTILYINPTLSRMLGIMEPEKLIGITCEQLFQNASHLFTEPQKFMLNINRYPDGREENIRDEVALTDGRIYSRNYLPIIENGKLNGYLWEFRDITHEKQVESALKEAKGAAETANIAKSQYLAYMTHEIRSPIHCIIGFLDLLKRTSLESQQEQYVNYIKDSSELLLGVVNNILDVSKIESGKLELENVCFNIKAAFNEVMSNLRMQAEGKSLQLKTKLDKNLPEFVEGDAFKFKQIITNLVANAIKYTQKGWIKAEISVLNQNGNDINIIVNVKDTGIGITSNKLASIFEPFSQGNATISREFGSTGLGLSICKSMVELMGGRICAESKAGKGSTFSFTALFIKAEVDTNMLKSGYSDNDANVENFIEDLKILLAEDNDINRELFKNMLKLNGYRCDVSRNGEEAVKACLKKDYDIIFMDCQMPVIDGYNATKMIRENEKKHAYIIALTANAMKYDLDKCLQSGMDDYISKPAHTNDVIRIIAKWGGKKVHNGTYSNRVISKLEEETGLGRKDSIYLVKKYYNQATRCLKTIKKQLKKKKWDKAALLLHHLKGVSYNIRATEIGLYAKEAEDALKNLDVENLESIFLNIQKQLQLLKVEMR